MILTIKGADFSAANIGTLNTVSIRKVIGRGLTHSIPNFVEKGSSVNWTLTLGENYEFGSYTVTMGSETITPTVDGSVMTISIANVTGAISISVATTYVGTEEEPVVPVVPTVYKTNKTLGIQLLEFGDFKFQTNATTQSSGYLCQVVAADVSNYVGKTITISTTHAYIKNNSTHGDAYYCFFLNAAPNDKTPEILSSITDLSDLGTVTNYSNSKEVILDKNIIVEKFDVVNASAGDKYNSKTVTVPDGSKYVYFTHTRKDGDDKEANINFN